jgi:hypothetical protein
MTATKDYLVKFQWEKAPIISLHDAVDVHKPDVRCQMKSQIRRQNGVSKERNKPSG